MQNRPKSNDAELSDAEYQALVDQEVAQCPTPSAKELEDYNTVFEQHEPSEEALSDCGQFFTKIFTSTQLLKRVLMFEVVNLKKPTSIVRIFLIQLSVAPANIAYRVFSTDSSDRELEKYAFFQVHLAARIAKNWSDAGPAAFDDSDEDETEDGEIQEISIDMNKQNFNETFEDDDDEDDDEDD